MIRGRLPLTALLATLALATPAAAQDTEREAAVEALEQAEAIAEGTGVRTGRELSPALAELAERRSDLTRSQRRKADALLARPTDPNDDGPAAPYSVASTSSCATHFCVHWVESSNDAPPGADGNNATVPPYVQTVKDAFEASYAVENVALGWRAPVPDGSRGGDAKTDVYIQDIGDQGLFGYASTDPQPANRSRFAYLGIDDDYAEFGYANPQDPLVVTAAHEYNHVLQYAYDALQDTWMFESTATWAEEKVFDAVNDYLFYLEPWAELPGQPLTSAGNPFAPSGLKMYGSAIWNHWLDSKYGPSVIRQAWALSQANSVAGGGFAPGAYDRAIRDSGGPGFAVEFADFTASTAEWDAANSGVREGAAFPEEVARSGSLSVNGAAVSGVLDHTAFALYEVPRTTATNLRLTGGLPAGTPGGIALVGFAGGTMTKVLGVLDAEGQVTVTLPDPGRFERITAVVTNADTSQAGYGSGDWLWTRDSQPFSLSAADVEPAPPPPPPPPVPRSATLGAMANAASLRLTRRSARIRRVARTGVLSFYARVNQAGRLTATATVNKTTARRLRIGRRTTRIGRGRRTARRAGRVKVNIRLTKKARARLKRQRRPLKVKVRTRFVPAGGGRAVARTVTLRLKA